MRWTDHEMCKHFGHIEDHQYKHFNRALGVKIESKEQFRHLLEQGNYIPYEEACKQRDKNVENQKYKGLPEKKLKYLHQLKSKANAKGELRWSDGLIKSLKENVGLDYSPYTKLPKHYRVDLDTEKGGIE